jgi:stage II sporulation protein AA (anti-sigma F factor antagonist)
MDGDDGIVWYLRASERDLGAVVVLSLEGRVSSATSASLAGWLGAQADRARRRVVVDMSGVDYINGTGLRLLATAAAQLATADGEMIVCGLRPVIRTVFDLAAPIPHLTIEPSADVALNRLLPSP